jgi:TctA family transporter
MLLAFILGPLMEEYMRRALLLSRGDPMVFLQRPISAALLAIGMLAVVVASLPSLTKKREEAFQGD